jgi:hypothetical protein
MKAGFGSTPPPGRFVLICSKARSKTLALQYIAYDCGGSFCIYQTNLGDSFAITLNQVSIRGDKRLDLPVLFPLPKLFIVNNTAASGGEFLDQTCLTEPFSRRKPELLLSEIAQLTRIPSIHP